MPDLKEVLEKTNRTRLAKKVEASWPPFIESLASILALGPSPTSAWSPGQLQEAVNKVALDYSAI